jgi:hypothetical protein
MKGAGAAAPALPFWADKLFWRLGILLKHNAGRVNGPTTQN